MNYSRFFFCGKRKALVSVLLALVILLSYSEKNTLMAYSSEEKIEDIAIETSGVGVEFQSKSCVLMEATTGTVLYDKTMNEKVSPASITKIMTLLLIFESIENGEVALGDQVVTSAYAKSMGGSQVFLEEGEKQTIETLIKCIVVASGNDACVAMAEHIGGSEDAFVERMNEKARELGMKNTNFEDCCGLSDSDNHYTSAYDVAIMARELIVNYPEIYNYSKIWMENITHITDKGESEFGLSNTNKLLKQYQYTTGLKTGSTSKAKYCVAATAKKDNVDLIAVIMGAPDFKVRFKEAQALLEYGFDTCKLYSDNNIELKKYMKVNGGESEQVKIMAEKVFNYVSTKEEDFASIKKDIIYNKKMVAPIKRGDTVGKIVYYIGENEVGHVNIVACEDIYKANYFHRFKQVFMKYLL